MQAGCIPRINQAGRSPWLFQPRYGFQPRPGSSGSVCLMQVWPKAWLLWMREIRILSRQTGMCCSSATAKHGGQALLPSIQPTEWNATSHRPNLPYARVAHITVFVKHWMALREA